MVDLRGFRYRDLTRRAGNRTRADDAHRCERSAHPAVAAVLHHRLPDGSLDVFDRRSDRKDPDLHEVRLRRQRSAAQALISYG